MQAGSFARLACEGGKTFAVRVAEDGKSARVRALHGSAELSAKGAGVFEGEGYKLMLEPPGGAALTHEGKDQGKGCKVQA